MSNSIRTDLTAKLVGQCGDDLWGSCAQFPVSDWKQGVEAGDTILGYWEWVIAQAEANGVDLDLLYGGAGKLAALERFAEMFDWSEEEARHARENINNTYGDECVVPLANGRQLCTPAFPEPAGYVRVVHHGFELAYWTSDEWRDDPEGVIGAFIGAANGVANPIQTIGA